MKKDLFADFDFSEEGALEREEKEFVAQYKSIRATYSIGLMCTKTGWLATLLASHKGAQIYPDKVIDLVVWV